MQPERFDPATRRSARVEQIAALHREHAGQVERRVARSAHVDHQTIEDACSFAWLQLLSHPKVDLGFPRGGVTRWLTQTATREAWRLAAARAHERPFDHAAIEHEQRVRGQLAPSADKLAAQRDQLDLVAEIPQRPRRFLLRLALGYDYHEIAAAEHVSYTTANKQIARARRDLRGIAAERAPQRRPLSAGHTGIGDELIAA